MPKRGLYTAALKRKLRAPPDGWAPSLLLTESQAAAWLGVNRRTLWRWRQAGTGPCPEPRDKWDSPAIWYRLSALLAWRNAVLGSGPTSEAEVAAQWLLRFAPFLALVYRPVPQPSLVEAWRRKGQRRREAKGLRMAEIKCRIAALEMALEEARLAEGIERLETTARLVR